MHNFISFNVQIFLGPLGITPNLNCDELMNFLILVCIPSLFSRLDLFSNVLHFSYQTCFPILILFMFNNHAMKYHKTHHEIKNCTHLLHGFRKISNLDYNTLKQFSMPFLHFLASLQSFAFFYFKIHVWFAQNKMIENR